MVGRGGYLESSGGFAANCSSSKRLLLEQLTTTPRVLGGLAVNFLDKQGEAAHHIAGSGKSLVVFANI
jgi:hypothetical protein